MNLNINCYDLKDQLTVQESIKGTSFVIQLPNKVCSLLKVIDNNLYALIDLDSLEKSYIQVSFIPTFRDIRYIDEVLNSSAYKYALLGEYKLDSDFVFLFGRILDKEEAKRLDD